MRPAVLALACLMASGCAVFNVNPDEASRHTAPPPPEGKRLAELVGDAFGRAKLTGKPEISPVRAAHDAQWGDWMFCIKSDSPADPVRFAVLIGHDAVLEVRSFVLIDGCDKETYHPLEPADQKRRPNGKSGGIQAAPHPQAQQTGAL
jgi:hypothetical protein